MNRRTLGFLLVILGASFWGVGGTVAQKLFQQYDVEVNWLVVIRLLLSGTILLLIHFLTKGPDQILRIWKTKKNAFSIILFGIFGMLGVQYTYMASIKHGNAAVATLLQYVAPVLIIIFLVARKQSKFTKQDFTTVVLALGGCFFLLTNGQLNTLSVPVLAVIWGLLSAVTLAFYTLYAIPLLKQFDSLVVVGWAMIIGGFGLSFIQPPWDFSYKTFPLEAYLYLAFVIVFGTMLAFWFYIASLQMIHPKETSLLGSLEPLTAVVTTVFWLGEPFGVFQWLGAFCLLIMIVLLALFKE